MISFLDDLKSSFYIEGKSQYIQQIKSPDAFFCIHL